MRFDGKSITISTPFIIVYFGLFLYFSINFVYGDNSPYTKFGPGEDVIFFGVVINTYYKLMLAYILVFMTGFAFVLCLVTTVNHREQIDKDPFTIISFKIAFLWMLGWILTDTCNFQFMIFEILGLFSGFLYFRYID